jgi:hypothetical protein
MARAPIPVVVRHREPDNAIFPLPPSGSALRSVLIHLLIACGFGLTLLVFYPGVMTFDARYVYDDMRRGFLGDWQSPVMTVLWSLIDPIAPGPASMFLLIATMYWLGFGLLAFTAAQRSLVLAVALLLLALSPPAFVFVGIIWRDVLLASAWLLAAALVFAFAGRGDALRIGAQAIALVLLTLGVLLRPNALIAGPVLATYLLWPAHFSLKRVALILVPAAAGLFALVQVVYYGVLGAERQNLAHAILVFDLGGISHFAKQNQFPGAWTEPETEMLTGQCYQPTEWDIYRTEPCTFVMERLTNEKLFGSPALRDAWIRAIAEHPLAYLQHRTALMWNFLSAENFTMWTEDLDDQSKTQLPDRSAFNALIAIHDALKPTPLFRAGTWLLICVAVCAFAWRRRGTPAAAFAIGVCGSAVVYVLTYSIVGVGLDFRYAYWAVLAGIAGGAMALLPDQRSERELVPGADRPN